MECPSCGFHHIVPKKRCVRCKKPIPLAGKSAGLSAESLDDEDEEGPIPAGAELADALANQIADLNLAELNAEPDEAPESKPLYSVEAVGEDSYDLTAGDAIKTPSSESSNIHRVMDTINELLADDAPEDEADEDTEDLSDHSKDETVAAPPPESSLLPALEKAILNATMPDPPAESRPLIEDSSGLSNFFKPLFGDESSEEAAPAVEESVEEAFEPAPPPVRASAETPPGDASSGVGQRGLDKFFGEPSEEESAGPAASEDENSVVSIRSPAPMDDGYSRPAPIEAANVSEGSSTSGLSLEHKLLRQRAAARSSAWWTTPTARRIGAGLFDFLVWVNLGLAMFEGALLITGAGPFYASAGQWAFMVVLPMMIVWAMVATAYGSLFGSLLGMTPGMMVFKLRLAAESGGPPKLKSALILSGLLWRKNQDDWLHDLAAGVKVEAV